MQLSDFEIIQPVPAYVKWSNIKKVLGQEKYEKFIDDTVLVKHLNEGVKTEDLERWLKNNK